MLIEYKKQSKSFNALKAATTVGELKAELQKVFRLNIHRQGLSIKPAAGADPKLTKKLDDDSKTLGEYGVNLDKDVLILKDYGPQIGYRTVFVVEYLGPILIMLAYYLRPSFIYGEKASANKDYNFVAMWGVLAWILHFVKRELETFFVHKFSRPTMPLSNLFKNSIYYWGFALAVGYPLCHPAYTAPKELNQVYLGAALMAVSELVNFLVHLQLSMMRPAEGSKKRDAPTGFLFSLVSCPNYTAEVLGWVGFTIMTQIAVSGVFCFVGFAQMSQWALQKHRGYLKADSEYKRLRRKAIVPFLL